MTWVEAGDVLPRGRERTAKGDHGLEGDAKYEVPPHRDNNVKKNGA